MKRKARLALFHNMIALVLTAAMTLGLMPAEALAEIVRVEEDALRELVISTGMQDGEGLAAAVDEADELAMDDRTEAEALAEAANESAEGLVRALADAADALVASAPEEAGEADAVRLAFAQLVRAQATAWLEEAGTGAEQATERDGQAPELAFAEVEAALKGEVASDAALVRALRLLLGALGVDAIEVSGEPVEEGAQARAWLLVRVDELWYHVDAVAAVSELVAELGSVDAAKALDDAMWTAHLGESCAWLLVSDEAMLAADGAPEAWSARETELERVGLAELPACAEAYEWFAEVEAELTAESTETEAVEPEPEDETATAAEDEAALEAEEEPTPETDEAPETDATPEAETDEAPEADATLEAEEDLAEAPTEDEPSDAAEANLLTTEASEEVLLPLELHLYQTGWLPTAAEIERDATELEAMAATFTTTQKQALQARVIRGCDDVVSSIDISDLKISTSVSTTALNAVISDVVNDNPDLFYVLSAWNVSVKYYDSNSGYYTTLYPYYFMECDSASKVAPMKTAYEKALANCLSWVRPTSSDYDKCKAVHDYLIKHCLYNLTVANGGNWSGTHSGFQADSIYTAYGCLVNGDAVCAGYSLAFRAAMKRLGIPCISVATADTAVHAWNKVKVNGNWYHIDCTWDDPLTINSSGVAIGDSGTQATSTTYFMKSDARMKAFGAEEAKTSSTPAHQGWVPYGEAATDTTFDYLYQGYWIDYSGPASTSTVTSFSLTGQTSIYTDAQTQISIYNVSPSSNTATYNATWKSSSSVVKVSSNGTVSSDKNVGKATVTCTIGNVSKSITITVYGDLSRATVSGISNKTYQGKAVTQSPTVKFAGKTLKSGTDYTLSYKNNNGVGTATVTITGKGYYKGSISRTFKITENVPTWTRYGGQTALDTAKLVVEADSVFKAGRGGTVIIATSNGYWDALAASALAGVFDAPVLITAKNKLSSQTRAEIKRLNPSQCIVVGGPAAVSYDVAWELYDLIGHFYRVYGETAVDTATKIFTTWNEYGYWGKTAIVATSRGYWDALSIAPYAYKAKAPIFLTGSGNKLTSATVSSIRSGKFSRVIIVGGTAAVSSSVEGQLKGAGVSTVKRLAGQTALDTSGVIAKWEIGEGMGVSHLTIATSNGYWDALTGAAVCGKQNSVLVLVSKGGDLRAFNAVYSRYAVTHGHILGGTAAIPASVERAVKNK